MSKQKSEGGREGGREGQTLLMGSCMKRRPFLTELLKSCSRDSVSRVSSVQGDMTTMVTRYIHVYTSTEVAMVTNHH